MTKDELANMLRAAAEAHHQYEKDTGKPDEDWPAWYADFMLPMIGASNLDHSRKIAELAEATLGRAS